MQSRGSLLYALHAVEFSSEYLHSTSLDEVQKAADTENPRKPYSWLLRKEVTELKEQWKILFSILSWVLKDIDLVKVEQKILLLRTGKVDQESP